MTHSKNKYSFPPIKNSFDVFCYSLVPELPVYAHNQQFVSVTHADCGFRSPNLQN